MHAPTFARLLPAPTTTRPGSRPMTRSASLITRRPTALPGLVAVVTLLTAPPAFAQTGADPTSPPAVAAAMNGNGGGDGEDRDPRGRRRSPDELVALGFSNVSINEVFPFIAEETGKIVIPIDVNLLQTKRITLLNDAPVPRSMALDLVFEAFRLNGVGVIEREDVVIVGNLDTITTNQVPPIIPAEEDIMSRRDRGTLPAATGVRGVVRVSRHQSTWRACDTDCPRRARPSQRRSCSHP